MRALSSLVLSLTLLTSSISAAAVDKQHKLNTVEDALSEGKAEKPVQDGPKAGATNSEAVSSKNTKFNGIDVPPMKELNGEKITEEIKDGYFFIKHYSPYCGHCKDIAPTWQTLYEFYYSSNPVTGKTSEKDSMNSFTRYYNLNFASLDCVAYGDACEKHDVSAYPTFSIYKDGVFLKKYEGQKTMETLSKFLEEVLESIRPGSRPKDGPKLPEPGATSVDAVAPKEVEKNEQEKKDVPEAPSLKKQPADKSKSTEKKQPAEKEKAKEEEFKVKENPTDTAETSSPTETSKARQKVKAFPKKKKPSGPPNPTGNSLSLTRESFQKLVTSTQDPWFVKFYAPWCHHCQALAPSWLQMAKEMQNKLNIGEVNCDAESRLCKDVRVKAYPTIHFFRGGERVEYDGLRGLGDLVNYAKKALDVGSGVPQVDLEGFKKLEETEEVIFIYFYDHATSSEDFESLERLTLSLVGHAKLVKSNDTALFDRFKISTWPRFVVSRSGRTNYYEPLNPALMRDFRQVLTWMQKVWLPIVPELSASNSRDIMKNKYVVLGILNREKADEFELDKREMKNAALEWMEKQTHQFELERQELRDAKQLRLEEAEDRNDDRAKRSAKQIRIDIREDDKKQVSFAWVDGIFWQRWLKTTYGIDVREGERVLILDEDVSPSPHPLSTMAKSLS